MKDLEGLLTPEGKIEAVFDIIREESLASRYAEHDLSSIHFVNHVRNYLNGTAGTAESVAKDVLPRVNHHYAVYRLDSNIHLSTGMKQLSQLITLFGGLMTLSAGYDLINTYNQVSSEQNSAGLFFLGIGVSLIGFGIVNSIKESRRLREHLKIREKIGDPISYARDRQPWIEAIEEIYKNEKYRNRAMSLVSL